MCIEGARGAGVRGARSQDVKGAGGARGIFSLFVDPYRGECQLAGSFFDKRKYYS